MGPGWYWTIQDYGPPHYVPVRLWHTFAIGFVLALIVTSALAQTARKYTKASQPPPGYTCADFYRSRDYGAIFANLYENPAPSVAPQMYCPGEPGQPPAIAQPKERR